MTYSKAVVFVEAPLFSRMVYDYLSEDDYAALQWTLILRPDAGDAIPGSGGLRKLRWSGSGRGKRGVVGSFITDRRPERKSGC